MPNNQNVDAGKHLQYLTINKFDLPNECGIIEPGLYRSAGYPFSLKKNKKYFDSLKLRSIVYLSQTLPNRDLRKYIHYKLLQARKYQNSNKDKNNKNKKNKIDTKTTNESIMDVNTDGTNHNNNTTNTNDNKNKDTNIKKQQVLCKDESVITNPNTTNTNSNKSVNVSGNNNNIFLFKHIGFQFFENNSEWYSLNTERISSKQGNIDFEKKYENVENIIIYETLKFILNKNNLPCMIMCDNGRFETSLIVACLRRLMNWNLTSIFREYYAFCKTYQRESDLQFIESFDCNQIKFNKIYKVLPQWFIYYRYDCNRIENLELKRKILSKYKDRIEKYKKEKGLLIKDKNESKNNQSDEIKDSNDRIIKQTEQLAYHKYMYDLYNAPLVSDPSQFSKKLSLVKQDND